MSTTQIEDKIVFSADDKGDEWCQFSKKLYTVMGGKHSSEISLYFVE